MNQDRLDSDTPRESRKIIVEFMSGSEDGRVTTCDQMPASIGRARDNSVQIPYDNLVSRHHAKIAESEGTFILFDLNSSNGTYLGRSRVQESAPINPGTMLRIGATLLRFDIRSPNAESD